MPCHRPTSWIYSPRDFPQWAKPEIFRHVRMEKPAGHPILSRKCQGQNGNGNSPANVLGLLGRIAASLVLPLLGVLREKHPSRTSRGKENVSFLRSGPLLLHSAAKDERPEPRRHLNG